MKRGENLAEERVEEIMVNVPKGTGRQSSKFCEEFDRFREEVQKKHEKKEVEEAAYTQTQRTKARPDAGACLKSQHSEGRAGRSL